MGTASEPAQLFWKYLKKFVFLFFSILLSVRRLCIAQQFGVRKVEKNTVTCRSYVICFSYIIQLCAHLTLVPTGVVLFCSQSPLDLFHGNKVEVDFCLCR